MFYEFSCRKFADISKWNVTKVKYMNYMFYEQSAINPYFYISNWDVSNVTESEKFYKDFSLKDVKNMDEFEKKMEERIKIWEKD